ncbi:MAG: hypothetical protein R3B06_03030 [Kofleriaceae bacterium]
MHAFTALSNHLHYMLSATMLEQIPLFLDYMLGNIARQLNKLRGRSGRVLVAQIRVAATRTGQLLLLVQARQGAAALDVAEVERLARAAAAHPGLIAQVAALAHAAHGTNSDAALAVYGALLAAPIPPDGYARTSWLYAANNALIVSHAARRFADSARMADQVVQYAPENLHITHAAACSYAAVGRHDDALAQVARAVELGYPHLDRMKVDPDLGPLLARADFQARLGKPRR